MSFPVPALAATGPNESLLRTEVRRRDPGPLDVVIDIKHTGICHTDWSMLHDEWYPGIFPMVPGHEITGIVREAGADVTRFAPGDRVGVGCYVNSCRECPACLAGDEQHCARGEVLTFGGTDANGDPTYGGYSTAIVVDERYVLRIPDGLDLEAAAPLLCAGITMYNPLRRWGVGVGSKVAIVGLGGLGHLGVQIAAALGAEVTVLGRTTAKQADSLRFGAVQHLATSEPATFTDHAGEFDVIISTISAATDLDPYLSLLGDGGVLVIAGVSMEPVAFRSPMLGHPRRIIASTKNGGITLTQEMLEFCADHGIAAQVERVAVRDVPEALERLAHGDVRYRFVIDTSTF